VPNLGPGRSLATKLVLTVGPLFALVIVGLTWLAVTRSSAAGLARAADELDALVRRFQLA
jgi:hypothetical protein